jgi:AraC-like DNA-binding protein
VPLADLENCAFPLEDVWGADARSLWEDLNTIPGESARLARLESALVQRTARAQPAEPRVNVADVVAWINASQGRLSVKRVAEATGLSRQHFARIFRTRIGVSPKVYCELTRFQFTLGYMQSDGGLGSWLHGPIRMIAEFRRFTGMTPEALRVGRWFHPFIERSALRLSNTHLTCPQKVFD